MKAFAVYTAGRVLVFAGVWLVAMRQPKVLEGQTVVE